MSENNNIIFISIIACAFGNSMNFGHYFVELAFKPIEKEYFIVNINKYKNIRKYSRSSSSMTFTRNINTLNEEPLIFSK